MNNADVKPCAVTFSERFDYSVRAEALRLLGSGCEIGVALNDTLSHPRLREIVMCLAHMAFGGVVDYYRGDDEAAGWCVSREHMLCDELANLEAEIETFGRTTKLTQMKTELLAQREAEIRSAFDSGAPAPQPRRPQLPAGARPDATTYRALSVWREREAAEES
jgi:hypothetical protein